MWLKHHFDLMMAATSNYRPDVLHVLFPIFQISLKGFLLHLTGKETEAQRMCSLPKVTPCPSARAGTRTQRDSGPVSFPARPVNLHVSLCPKGM